MNLINIRPRSWTISLVDSFFKKISLNILDKRQNLTQYVSQYKNVLQNSPSLPSLENKSSLVFTDPRENDRLKKQKTIES